MEDNNIHDIIEEYKKPLVENSLNRLFSSGQIKIIKKTLCKQELTKSEKEVFSRVIKKKIQSIRILNDLDFILK